MAAENLNVRIGVGTPSFQVFCAQTWHQPPAGTLLPAKIVQVTDIPRTKSGKIVELAVRNVVHGRPVKNLEALSNPEALEEFRNRAELKS